MGGLIVGFVSEGCSMKSLRFVWTLVGLVSLGALASCDSSSDSTNEEIPTPRDSVGSVVPWNDSITYGTLTDVRDGKSYRTVNIGTQTWMAENLNYAADSSWYLHGSNVDSAKKYGRLYQWAALMNLPDSCNQRTCSTKVLPTHLGICPTGWHVPDNADWDTLTNTGGGYVSLGAKLKSTTGWPNVLDRPDPNQGNGKDVYGFRAIPSGLRDTLGALRADHNGYWWSATEANATLARDRGMNHVYDTFYDDNGFKRKGFAARCVKDE